MALPWLCHGSVTACTACTKLLEMGQTDPVCQPSLPCPHNCQLVTTLSVKIKTDTCCVRCLHTQDAFIPQDRESGRSRGFAFVTMSDAAAAQEAIAQLNEQEFNVSTRRTKRTLILPCTPAWLPVTCPLRAVANCAGCAVARYCWPAACSRLQRQCCVHHTFMLKTWHGVSVLQGRTIRVNEAQPPGSGGGGGYRGGGGGGGYSGGE
jgi:RNA recognition motif-containing protein